MIDLLRCAVGGKHCPWHNYRPYGPYERLVNRLPRSLARIVYPIWHARFIGRLGCAWCDHFHTKLVFDPEA